MNDDRNNSSLQSVSVYLDLAHSDTRGRHYIANQDIVAGTPLLIDQPVRSPPYPSYETGIPERIVFALTMQLLESGKYKGSTSCDTQFLKPLAQIFTSIHS